MKSEESSHLISWSLPRAEPCRDRRQRHPPFRCCGRCRWCPDL